MRPFVMFVPLLVVAGFTAGCVAPGAYPAGYAQPGYTQQDQVVEQPTYYNDQPAVLYGGQPAYIVEDPGLGWGWYDPGRHWHGAPRGWRGPEENSHFRRDVGQDYRQGYRPDFRQDNRTQYRQDNRQDYRQDNRQQFRQEPQRQEQRQEQRQQEQRQQQRPQQQQQQQRPQPQPQRQENRRVCPPGQVIC